MRKGKERLFSLGNWGPLFSLWVQFWKQRTLQGVPESPRRVCAHGFHAHSASGVPPSQPSLCLAYGHSDPWTESTDPRVFVTLALTFLSLGVSHHTHSKIRGLDSGDPHVRLRCGTFSPPARWKAPKGPLRAHNWFDLFLDFVSFWLRIFGENWKKSGNL